MVGLVLTWMCCAAATVDPVDGFLAELAKKRETLVTIEARFTHESRTLDDTHMSSGAVVYVKPRRIVFRWEEPDKVVYLADGPRLYEYDAGLEQLKVYDMKDDPETEALFIGFEQDPARLRKAYTLALIDPKDAPGAVKGLEMRPKPQDILQQNPEDQAHENSRRLFEYARVYFREGDYLPCRIEIINDPESKVTVSFSEFKVNQPLDAAKTQVALPEGTKIIENEDIFRTVGPEGLNLPEPVFPDTTPPQTDNKKNAGS